MDRRIRPQRAVLLPVIVGVERHDRRRPWIEDALGELPGLRSEPLPLGLGLGPAQPRAPPWIRYGRRTVNPT
jgi:hypothetical protein